MSSKAAITVRRPPDEVKQLWESSAHRPEYIQGKDVPVRFVEAPGDRGTEIHVDLEGATKGGKLGDVVQKITGAAPLAKVKDDLRRFKQAVETGEIPRSDGVPEGEKAERKLKQRPAQPLADHELEKAGV
jgi:uncharacterized membrane protein